MWQRAGYCSCLCGLSIEFEQKESRNYIFFQPNEKASPIFFSYYEYMYCIPFLRNKMFMLDYRLDRQTRSPPVMAGNFKSVFVHTNDNSTL